MTTVILALDIGNTNMEFGLFEGRELRFSFRLGTNRDATSDEIGIMAAQFFAAKAAVGFATGLRHALFSHIQSLSFSEMNGETMLLMNDIGFWNFVRTEKMPDSRFLTQSDRFSFNELVEASTLPSFTTDLAHKYIETGKGRIEVPISDPEATVTYYLVCKKDREEEYLALFSALQLPHM